MRKCRLVGRCVCCGGLITLEKDKENKNTYWVFHCCSCRINEYDNLWSKIVKQLKRSWFALTKKKS